MRETTVRGDRNRELLSQTVRGIIFDCDGVLVMNTNEIYDEALTLAVRSFKSEFSDIELKDLKSSTRGKTFHYQLEKILGIRHPHLGDAVQQYEKYLHSDNIFNRISLLEGTDQVLMTLKHEGYVLAMATGMNPSLLTRLFREKILPNDIFEHIGSIHDISNPELQKPHPKILLDLLSSLKLSPEQVAYIGDTEDDIIMARRSRIFSIAVLTGRLNESHAKTIGADLILTSVLELPKWI